MVSSIKQTWVSGLILYFPTILRSTSGKEKWFARGSHSKVMSESMFTTCMILSYSKPYQWIQFLVRFRILLFVAQGPREPQFIQAHCEITWEAKLFCRKSHLTWIYEGLRIQVGSVTSCVRAPEKSLSFFLC